MKSRPPQAYAGLHLGDSSRTNAIVRPALSAAMPWAWTRPFPDQAVSLLPGLLTATYLARTHTCSR